jgi:hypothetical protein
VPDVGPYCFKSALSREVIPCQVCCTEAAAQYDEDGVCF